MSQAQLLQLARHGDTQAIVTLLNRCLQIRRVTLVEASFNESCLELKLVSPKVPNQYKLLPFLRDEISSLGIASLETVNIHALTDISSAPAWEASLTLEQDWSDRLSDAVVKAKRTSAEEIEEEIVETAEASPNQIEEPTELANTPIETTEIEPERSPLETPEIQTEILTPTTQKSSRSVLPLALAFVIGLLSGLSIGYFFSIQQTSITEPTVYSLPQQ